MGAKWAKTKIGVNISMCTIDLQDIKVQLYYQGTASLTIEQGILTSNYHPHVKKFQND